VLSGGKAVHTFRTSNIPEMLDPIWNCEGDMNWEPEHSLQFEVYDQGTLKSRKHGSITLPSAQFFPDGYDGTLQVAGAAGPTLSVRIQALSAE